MRTSLAFMISLVTCASFSQMHVDDLKIDGKEGPSFSDMLTWKSSVPAKNDLAAAKVISKVRQSFRACKSKDEAFKVAAKWIKPKHSSPVETCASIEALYHLQLWVRPEYVNFAVVKSVWNDHVKLSSPAMIEHARQAVLVRACWAGTGVRYPVIKAVFDAYDDDPAMAFFWRNLWDSQRPPDKRSTQKLAATLEFRSRHLNGIVLDEMRDSKSSSGQLLIAAAYGWSRLVGSPGYPTAKEECLKLYKEAIAIDGKSKPLAELTRKFGGHLRGKGLISK